MVECSISRKDHILNEAKNEFSEHNIGKNRTEDLLWFRDLMHVDDSRRRLRTQRHLFEGKKDRSRQFLSEIYNGKCSRQSIRELTQKVDS